MGLLLVLAGYASDGSEVLRNLGRRRLHQAPTSATLSGTFEEA